MNTKPFRKMVEDRDLRNAARALFRADIEHLRGDIATRGIRARIVDRASDGALDVFEEAVESAESHRGILAGVAAVIALWFARAPIMALFGDEDDADGTEDDSQDDSGDNSRDDGK